MIFSNPTLADLGDGTAVQSVTTKSLQAQLADLYAMLTTRQTQIANLPANIPQSTRDYYAASLIELNNAINSLQSQIAAQASAPSQQVVTVVNSQNTPQYYVANTTPGSGTTFQQVSAPAPIKTTDRQIQTSVPDYVPPAAVADPVTTYAEAGGTSAAATVDTPPAVVTESAPSNIPWGLLAAAAVALFGN